MYVEEGCRSIWWVTASMPACGFRSPLSASNLSSDEVGARLISAPQQPREPGVLDRKSPVLEPSRRRSSFREHNPQKHSNHAAGRSLSLSPALSHCASSERQQCVRFDVDGGKAT